MLLASVEEFRPQNHNIVRNVILAQRKVRRELISLNMSLRTPTSCFDIKTKKKQTYKK